FWPIGEISEATLQEYIGTLEPFIGKGLTQPEPRLTRLYSDIGVAPHIVGYTGFIPAEEIDSYLADGYRGDEQVGLVGVERWGEEYLNGERGGILTVVGPSGEFISTVQEISPKQARSVYTSLELDYQAAVEQALAQAILTLPAGVSSGAVVVMDVNSGAIRAMASYPTYNPNVFDLAQPDADVNLGQLFNDPTRPLFNRAAQGAYPAGSLFKIVTMTAGLNSGLYTPQSLYTSTGSWNVLGDNFIKTDWLETGHGTVSLADALVVSCNSCFYDVAYNLDLQDPYFFPNVAKSFGLGNITGLQGVREAAGLIPDPDWKIGNVGEGWANGDAVNMGIGQGFVQVTPLQMTTIFSAIANGGIVYQPTLVDRIGEGGGAPVETLQPRISSELPIRAEDLGIIRDSLWKVANSSPNGTASLVLADMSIPTAGKTGTAEAPPNAPHAWYGGYAPAGPFTNSDGIVITEPEIAVVVIVENGGQGSEVAAPIFRRVIELYYGIQPVTPYPWGG
ncbi:MAG: penicillin-binding transpeptidase domain-containing protein, partial [Chloroflexota bacterium]